MFDILSLVQANLLKPPAVNFRRVGLNANPSSCMTYSIDNKPIGSCIRQVWFDKKGYEKSNPMGIYNKFITEAGHLWEAWITDQYKQIGIYLDHSVRVAGDGVSGEIDILHKNLETGAVEVSEIKQYDGSNFYAAKEILGSGNIHPKPKDQNLLQCVRYLMICQGQVSTINLIYLDRSCKSFYNNKQFSITLNAEGHPVVSYKYLDDLHVYVDKRFTTQSILDKESLLNVFLKLNGTPPPPDYKLRLTEQEVKERYEAGGMSAKAYADYTKDKSKVISDWQCTYCAYGYNRDTFASVCEANT